MKRDLDYMIAVMKAAKEGKGIEYYDKYSGRWSNSSTPNWDWSNFDFRIKPEDSKPEYVPYESTEEFLLAQKEHGYYISTKRTGLDKLYTLPSRIINDYCIIDDCPVTYDQLLSGPYTWQDGTPCGKLKESEL